MTRIISVYAEDKTFEEIEKIALKEKRARSNMANIFLEEGIKNYNQIRGQTKDGLVERKKQSKSFVEVKV